MSAIIVHGGAWSIPDVEVAPHQHGCRLAAAAGWQVLEQGGSAFDAVTAAITLLEDDPTFDAGTGSVLNVEGFVELDAALMDGRTLRYGAVAGLRRVRNPILLARSLLEHAPTMLVGEGAERFARSQGFALIDGSELIVARELERWQAARDQPAYNVAANFAPPSGPLGDTVGAIALDADGRLVVGNSTGGVQHKPVGRVGDTPLIGCGLYADDQAGACACTGLGETITRAVLARHTVDLLGHGLAAPEAARRAVAYLGERVGGLGGCIVLDPAGNVGLAFNTPRMAYAYRTTTSGQLISGV